MTDAAVGQTLSTAPRIGVLGDTHGDLNHLLRVSGTMWKRGVSVLLVLGDFGFVWRSQHGWERILDEISKQFESRGQALYFCEGNHDDFSALKKFSISADGLRWVRPNIFHIPRGYRTTLASGKSLAVLGGANSVDYAHRRPRYTWWPEESITEADLAALGTAHADVMVGHDAPLNVPTLDAHLLATNHWWSADGVKYSEAGRRMFHRGFLQVQPQLYLGGHYHLPVDDTVEFGEGEDAFTCRVVILDMNEGRGISQGILDVQTLKIDLFMRDDNAVTELTGKETGVWHVHTSDGMFIVNFFSGTLARRPHPGGDARSTDSPRPLSSIEICRAGEIAFWKIGDSTDSRWQTSGSAVTRIERQGDDDVEG